MARPKLIATFRPQAWVNDYAIDVDGAVDFDVAAIVLALTPEEIRAFDFNNYDSDNLAQDLPERQQHSGPFEVDIDEEAWRGFWKRLGVDETAEINADQLATALEKYKDAQ